MEQNSLLQSPPEEADVRGELDRLLRFPALLKSPQLASFLRYVIDARLASQPENIRGYTIAVHALGRDPSFDPQSNSIVRVEAMRLRRQIAKYYNGPGAQNPVRITLPQRGYSPVFEWAKPPVVSAPSIVPPSSPPESCSHPNNVLTTLAGKALSNLRKIAVKQVAGLFRHVQRGRKVSGG